MTYEIGFRRPPKHAQFKKGSSGNPKGRPKGASGFATLLQEELSKKIVVTENGKKRSLTRLQALVKRMVSGALQGDPKQLMALVEILRRMGTLEGPPAEDWLPPDHEAFLRAYVDANQVHSDAPAPSTRPNTDTNGVPDETEA